MDRPRTVSDDWWIALLWVADEGGLATFRDLGPAGGPPPGSPLARLGPALAGGLSGLILEEDGRTQLRLRLGRPPDNEAWPWEAPAAVLLGLRFEPARAATMRATELAAAVLAAFARAVEALARP